MYADWKDDDIYDIQDRYLSTEREIYSLYPCVIQAAFFDKNGSPMSGPSCSASQNDGISAEVDASFSGGEIGQSYAATMQIRIPNGSVSTISSAYQTVTDVIGTFVFGNWSIPIPTGMYTILGSSIIDTIGNTVCTGNFSGGNCQSLTIIAASPSPTPTPTRSPTPTPTRSPTPTPSITPTPPVQAGFNWPAAILIAGLAIGAIFIYEKGGLK